MGERAEKLGVEYEPFNALSSIRYNQGPFFSYILSVASAIENAYPTSSSNVRQSKLGLWGVLVSIGTCRASYAATLIYCTGNNALPSFSKLVTDMYPQF